MKSLLFPIAQVSLARLYLVTSWIITGVCVIFLIKLRWPRNKSLCDTVGLSYKKPTARGVRSPSLLSALLGWLKLKNGIKADKRNI